jgi:protein tyrosine phosphatase (PTP) superfamily phosphohydrolase (DUF442 family)
MNINNSKNFRRITTQLTTSGSVSEEQLACLKSQGYEAVINLLPPDNKHALASEQMLVESQGIDYIQIPVEWDAPTEDNYSAFVAALEQTRQQKTHVHCAANWRVSGFYAIYAIDKGFWNQSTACEHVRDLWNPNNFTAWKQFLGNHGLQV